MYFAPRNFKTCLRAWIRCSAKCWDESQWGFSFYGVDNELLLRIICHTERLKLFQITTGGQTQKYFHSDWMSFLLLFMGKISPVATGGFWGLSPQTKLQSPINWNTKHYMSVEFLLIFRVSSPPAHTQSPPRRNAKPPYWKLSGDGSV